MATVLPERPSDDHCVPVHMTSLIVVVWRTTGTSISIKKMISSDILIVVPQFINHLHLFFFTEHSARTNDENVNFVKIKHGNDGESDATKIETSLEIFVFIEIDIAFVRETTTLSDVIWTGKRWTYGCLSGRPIREYIEKIQLARQRNKKLR